MSAGRKDFCIEQGIDWTPTITWKDSNSAYIITSGYTADMQVRARRDSSAILLELSTSNGRITVTGASGLFSLSLTAAETRELDFDTGVYDFEVTSVAGIVYRLLEGNVTLSREVTR